MTNELVVIINSLKVPKIKKILLYEIFCTKLHLPPEPMTRKLPPPDPHSLCPLSSTEFVDPPPEQNSWVLHCLQIIYTRTSTTSLSVRPQYGPSDCPRNDRPTRTLKFGHEPQEWLDTKKDSPNDASMSLIFTSVNPYPTNVENWVSS